jgi:LasA protease
MDKSLKQWTDRMKRTRSGVDRWFPFVVGISVFVASLACAQDTVSVSMLMETQAALQTLAAQATVPPEEEQVMEDFVEAVIVPGPLEMEPIEEEVWEIEPTPEPAIVPTVSASDPGTIRYVTLNGDTINSVARRFEVNSAEISGLDGLNPFNFLPVGTELILPDKLEGTSPPDVLLPDSELIFSPTASDFDITGFVNGAGGYLSTYRESTVDGMLSGAEIIARAATKHSINPRLLLTLLQYQSDWVYGTNPSNSQRQYPMGYFDSTAVGLEKQLNWACRQLSTGFYGWRTGRLLYLTFSDGGSIRLSPFLNAGTVGLEYFLAQTSNVETWYDALYGSNSVLELHSVFFGDFWGRSRQFEPYLNGSLSVPPMEFPFETGRSWNYTGGPHEAWGEGTPFAALDFAPMGVADCDLTNDWITAIASGIVVRSEPATVVLDTDMDGDEQTGWVIFYYHVRSDGRIPTGVTVEQGARIGHPSCEGGTSTGTHVHIARKFNGEWVSAGEPGAPWVMSGWMAMNGPTSYQGLLVKNDVIIKSSRVSSVESSVVIAQN